MWEDYKFLSCGFLEVALLSSRLEARNDTHGPGVTIIAVATFTSAFSLYW
jgi:hypothetical protein